MMLHVLHSYANSYYACGIKKYANNTAYIDYETLVHFVDSKTREFKLRSYQEYAVYKQHVTDICMGCIDAYKAGYGWYIINYHQMIEPFITEYEEVPVTYAAGSKKQRLITEICDDYDQLLFEKENVIIALKKELIAKKSEIKALKEQLEPVLALKQIVTDTELDGFEKRAKLLELD